MRQPHLRTTADCLITEILLANQIPQLLLLRSRGLDRPKKLRNDLIKESLVLTDPETGESANSQLIVQ